MTPGQKVYHKNGQKKVSFFHSRVFSKAETPSNLVENEDFYNVELQNFIKFEKFPFRNCKNATFLFADFHSMTHLPIERHDLCQNGHRTILKGKYRRKS